MSNARTSSASGAPKPTKPPTATTGKAAAAKASKPAAAKPTQALAKKPTPASTTLAAAKPARGKAAPIAANAASAASKRAETLLAEIERRKTRIAEDFYDIGEALHEILKKKLFGALGYATFEELLKARNVMSLSQAHRLVRIVSTLPRDKALAAGSEKASLLAGYADATPEPDTAEWLLDQGTLPDGKPIATATTRELADAVKKARAAAGTTSKRKPTPDETKAHAAAKSAQASLRKRGAKQATATALKRGSTWWVRVEVPVESVDLVNG